MLTVTMRSSVVRFTQHGSSMIVREIAYRESPTASRRNWLDLHGIGTRQQLSTDPEVKRLTVRKRDKCGSVVYELCLRYGTRELHRTLNNHPSLGPELIGEGAKVSGVPMQR